MFSAIYVGYVVVILSQYYRSYLSKQSQKNMFYERFFIRVVIKETMVVKSNAQFNWKYEKYANLKGSNKTLKCRHWKLLCQMLSRTFEMILKVLLSFESMTFFTSPVQYNSQN